ncbi:uncharacterized protein TRAVEDRAFT_66650 [Trametes versicolor FP-101664 SS1]|uniref:uncharacterized protein n=1 Tax=Trametes versicolor (strain FP-101664) TaxID=717944 RepID=UPI000462285D|nr:uncharacterized protein TRAVEDRAFT_66650 [Trametes versicolor FP-101664 SS1]EIW53970.1 hypothetical protein TRAVEDRAFT_66650 [Trametes versicolor FP-101664 SS1]
MRVEYHPRRIKDNYSLYIRPWDEIESMPAFFAMLRGIEKRFGRVREFRTGRDYDIPSKYTGYFIADLEDSEAYQRVPEKGTSVKVEVPVSKRDRPGGIGLDDLQELLQAQEWDAQATGDGIYSTPIRPVSGPEGETPRETRVVELIVQRSTAPQTEVRHRRRMKETGEFGLAFHRWAGFYKPEEGLPIQREMERALTKWEPFVAERASQAQARASARVAEVQVDDEPESDFLSMRPPAGYEPQAEDLEEPSKALDASASATESSPLAASTSAPAAETDSLAPPPAPETQQPVRLSQREKILQRARLHAKTPLPEPITEEAKAQKEAEERARKAEEQQTTSSLREKLVKLMGGNWS